MSISKIKKRDGKTVKFDSKKIAVSVYNALKAVKRDDEKLAKKVSDEIVKDLEKIFKIRQVPEVKDVQNMVEEILMKNGLSKAARVFREKNKEERKVEEFLDVPLKVSLNATRVLEKRYLLKDSKGNIIEKTEDMFKRVSKNIAKVEKKDRAKWEKEFYTIMAKLEFLPNSPTLMNAGTDLGLLSACVVIPIEDSLKSIFDALKTAALVQQAGAGTGFTFSHIRPKGDMVQSTKGIASGPVSFISIFDRMTNVIKKGSRRRGANMGILRVDHPDIIEFITSKSGNESFSNFNFSIGITDDFMKAVKKNNDYNLINPRTGKAAGKLNASGIFDMICTYAWRTGDPGLVFLDKINSKNPLKKNLGDIEATNPCVAGNALVSTDKGLERFEDLVNAGHQSVSVLTDNRVPIKVSNGHMAQYLLMKEQNAVKLCNTTALFDSGIKQTLKLITKSGYELVATPDHKIMTSDGWVRMENLTEDHKVLLQCKEGKFNQDYRLLFTPKNIIKGKNGRTYTFNMPKKWSKELGQIIGWLVGDGHFSYGKDCRVAWIFGKKDYPVMDYFKPILEDIYDGKPTEQLKDRDVRCLTFHSKFFADFFMKLGVKPVCADEKEVPNSIFTAPKEAVIGFLQGLFTADGTVNYIKDKSSYVRLTSKSEKLLKQVQLLLLNLGIKSKIYSRHRKPQKKFFYTTVKGEKREYLTDGILFELEVSKDSVLKFLDNVGFLCGRHDRKISLLRSKSYYSDYFFDKVKTVKDHKELRVYDLTEPLTHSFISNGIIVSNCGEVPLYPYESCNLGSINLSRFVKDKKIDWNHLKGVIKTAVRFLDNVIDVNTFPLKDMESITKSNRRIGLGVMGFAEMLIQLDIAYDSKDAVNMAEKLMKFINTEAVKVSEDLAKEKGVFPNFKNSSFKKKRRNVAVTTIAPTGSISIIAGCSSGIEPLFAVAFIRKVLGGTKLVEINPYFERMAKAKGFYSEELMSYIARTGSIQKLFEVPDEVKKIFRSALDIDPEYHVKVQSAFQSYTENAVSKTVNLPREATVEDVKEVYWHAFRSDCKGITVYRYGSKKEQVLYLVGLAGQEEGETLSYISAEPEYSGGCPSPFCPH
ncbi:MAG: ribonucleoside reductase class II [Nanoarchaeota archaeon]|nr:ribonucleoside reductase class II [Nanoarchaeota archaeon]